jgi:hypothetical protein
MARQPEADKIMPESAASTVSSRKPGSSFVNCNFNL